MKPPVTIVLHCRAIATINSQMWRATLGIRVILSFSATDCAPFALRVESENALTFEIIKILSVSVPVGHLLSSHAEALCRMTKPLTSEALAEYFVRYLFEEYHGTRHVRRVASWVGFIVKGIERVIGQNFQLRRSRQIGFEYHGRQFKVKYVHRTKACPRGSVQILEVSPGRGAPEGNIVVEIGSLADAERVYQSLGQQLNAFLAAHQST